MTSFSLRNRSSGLLLHPTSLPGPFGIGDLGENAVWFLHQLKKSGQRWWQMLPLNPVDMNHSPYNSPSAFAGNPLLIDPQGLVKMGLVDQDDINDHPPFPDDHVAYDDVTRFKEALLEKAASSFFRSAQHRPLKRFRQFAESQMVWLDSYALFLALKKHHGHKAWIQWPTEFATRQPEALAQAARELAPEIEKQKFIQFIFFDQWSRFKEHARQNGIGLIGDIPIFVSYDSSDVWANPDLFHLDKNGKATAVAGVPPDYFSADGQKWGNPLYRWDVHKERDFSWWIHRLRHILMLVDAVRIDHFIGFIRAWTVLPDAPHAREGTWQPGPGELFFEKIFSTFLNPLLIAEDLGTLTPEVEKLRDLFKLPGMKVLQFAFGNPDDKTYQRPPDYPANCLVYTGTHDNNTTRAWIEGLTAMAETAPADSPLKKEIAYIQELTKSDGKNIAWDILKLGMACPANLAITPVQDVLGLGEESRMNKPGVAKGNWAWRLNKESFTSDVTSTLRELTEQTHRL